MKRLNKFLTCMLMAMPLGGLAAAMALTQTHVGSNPLELTEAPVNPSSVREKAVKADGFLYENFESVADGETSLPDGWTATSTPGQPDDTWHAGTLGRDGTPLNGVSGYKYAYILGNRNGGAHDSWLFSPGLEMEAGTEYTIEFFALMPPVTGDEILEKLQVCVCDGNTASNVVKELEVIENDNDYWRYYGYKFTPEQNGTYNIGFHSISPANSNSTVIDDLKISSGPMPVFYGNSEMDLGTTDTRLNLLKGSYTVSNRGTAPLEVSLVSASEGVSVEGLPLTVADDDYERISITAVPGNSGDFEGEVVLKTNDPTLPSVTIKLTGEVKQARVTGYHFEDFETGGPEGWDLSFGSGNVSVYGGHNSSRAYYTTTVYYDDPRNEELGGVGFTTHYVEMGEDPKISFWYQMAKVDYAGTVSGAAEPGDVSVKVMVSADEGHTYDTVYSIEPGGEHQHVATLDWTQITIPVPQYAGKTCRLRFVFNQPSGASFFNQVRCMADDIEIGTKVENDLRATSLTGSTLLHAGNEYEFTATVENLGSETMSDYSMQLLDADGRILDTAEGVAVEASGNNTVKLHWTPSQSGKAKLNAKIVSGSDPIEENNVSYTHYAQVLPEDNTPLRIEHGEALAAMAFPINFYAVESATQSIYTANEIGTTRGEINSLVFTSYLDADFYGEPFEVFITETGQSDFSNPKFIDPESFTKVFEGAVYMQSGTNDVVIPFDVPYSYKGGNIAVMCKKIGKEFVMGKYFVIHKCDGSFRSIQSTSFSSGTIEANGFADAAVAEVYPQIRFNIVKADAGSVEGTVSDINGAVEGAVVRVKGTQRYETTDAQGRFSFSEVASGKCVIEVIKHGYYTLTDNEFTLEKGGKARRELKLEMLPRHTMQGTVTSAESGQPVRNVKISLDGYDSFTAFTDGDGHYIIENIAGDTGETYTVTVSNGYFKEQNTSVDINEGKTLDFTLDEKTLRAHNAVATSTDNGVMVTWEKPMPEFRHDSGEVVDYIGWTHGNSEVIVGAAFHKKAKIKEISWYVTDKYGSHSNFNVFIFGLDEEGKPNPKNILYIARNVEFKDNEWSTHIIGNAVEADGFMIAVSCNGFMGMGICEPTEEYPFNEGECYYAGDSYNMTISNMSSFAKVHPMLRAYGEDLDCANEDALTSDNDKAIDRPATEYKVYRAYVGSSQDEWTPVGNTTSLSWLDTTPNEKPSFYAIVASYASGDADAVTSNPVSFSSVESLSALGISVGPNPMDNILNIRGGELISNLSLFAADGKLAASVNRPGESLDVSDLTEGIYMAVLTLNDGTVHTVRLIKR